MGLGSHTQTNDRAIAPGTPVTGLRSGSRRFLSAGPTAQAGLRGNGSACALGPASEDACTGRAAGSTGNLTRSALMPFGGVA
jgi:hypothetical protein